MPGPGSPVPGTLSRTSHDRDSPREDADVKEPVMPGAVPNPLRSVLDRRLPRIAGPCVLVLFGVTGDLSRKKLLPAIYDLANRGLLPPGFGLVGFARRDWADQDFTQVAYDAVRTHARTPFREDVWRQLSEGVRFVPGEAHDDAAFDALVRTVRELDESRGTGGNYAFYLSLPPKLFPTVLTQLKRSGLAESSGDSWRRVVIEKPFGHDLASAQELNALVDDVFPPHSVFRIDHYLGKETVQNLLALRSPTPCSSRSGTARISTTSRSPWPRTSGWGDAAGYYDGIGAARDIIQNHLLQLLALVAMEEPRPSPRTRSARRRSKRCLAVQLPDASLRPVDRARPVHRGLAGRRRGSRLLEEEGIPPNSTTETYAAMRLGVNTRRWAGVPFYLRTGKRLGRRVTEVALVFHRTANQVFDHVATANQGANSLVIRIQPDEGVTLRFGSKVPGTAMEVRDVSMDFSYGASFTETSPEAYERLILDVLIGDPPLFPHQEEVELSWRILDPVEEFWAKNGRPEPYPAGSWGPPSGHELLARDNRTWRRP